jgi:limonene-1,2-epoxide hydrolase
MKIVGDTRERNFVPDREWWERLFLTVDSGNAAAFVAFLTPDARFRFGNSAVMIGRQQIGEAVSGFFAVIASSRHRLLGFWSTGEFACCEGEVTYTRHDASIVSFPFANVFEFRGEMISAYRIYIDIASLFTAPA